jgi:hypothetical protein
MRRKLTAKALEYLHARGPKRLDVWDTVLQGFGVRVSPTGRKVWFVVVRPNGAPRRITIGTYPAISLAQAREARAASYAASRWSRNVRTAPLTTISKPSSFEMDMRKLTP